MANTKQYLNQFISISSSLRSRRINAGLTQEKLGYLACLSRNTISSLECLEYSVTLKHALLIARALNCNVEDIWSLDDDLNVLPSIDVFEPCCPKFECVGCNVGCYSTPRG